MEQVLLELFKTVTIRVLSPFNGQPCPLVSEIVAQIFDGNLETALEIITTNGSGGNVLQPLHQSILKRIVLRLLWPSNPGMYLQGVELDAPLIATVAENISEENLEQLYIAVFTKYNNNFEKVFIRYIMLRFCVHVMKFRKLQEKFTKINHVPELHMQPFLLACSMFAIMMSLLNFFQQSY